MAHCSPMTLGEIKLCDVLYDITIESMCSHSIDEDSHTCTRFQTNITEKRARVWVHSPARDLFRFSFLFLPSSVSFLSSSFFDWFKSYLLYPSGSFNFRKLEVWIKDMWRVKYHADEWWINVSHKNSFAKKIILNWNTWFYFTEIEIGMHAWAHSHKSVANQIKVFFLRKPKLISFGFESIMRLRISNNW